MSSCWTRISQSTDGEGTERFSCYQRGPSAWRRWFLGKNTRTHGQGTSLEEIAAEPIEDYWLVQLQAWPIGEDAALASYEAKVQVKDIRVRELAVTSQVQTRVFDGVRSGRLYCEA